MKCRLRPPPEAPDIAHRVPVQGNRPQNALSSGLRMASDAARLRSGNSRIVGAGGCFGGACARSLSTGGHVKPVQGLIAKLAAGLAVILLAVGLAGPVRAEGAFVGLQVQGLSAEIAAALELPAVSGVLVRDVAPGGPGGRAGVRRGDLIVGLGDRAIVTFDDLIGAVAALAPGDAVPLRVQRSDAVVALDLRTEGWPAGWRVDRGAFAALPALGVTLAALTDPVRARFGVRWGTVGAVVTLVDPAMVAGIDLKPGDVIAEVNRRAISSPLEVSEAWQAAKDAGRPHVLLLVDGAGGWRYALLPVR